MYAVDIIDPAKLVRDINTLTRHKETPEIINV